MLKHVFKHWFKIALAIVIYAILLFVSMRQNANSQIIDSSFYAWSVYEISEDDFDYKKCYIVSHPVKSNSDHNSRQLPYLMITRFQKDRTEEVSLYSGYEYKLNSKVSIMLDQQQFSMVAKENMAWNKSKYDDLDMINHILHSGVFKARSDSAFGTFAIDEYSLKGVAKAYNRMREICR